MESSKTKRILFLDDCNGHEWKNPRACLVEVENSLSLEKIRDQEFKQIGCMRLGGSWKKAMETGSFSYIEIKQGKKSDFKEEEYDEIYRVISGNY